MKKILLLAVLCVNSLLYGYAQDSDKASLECIYRLTFLKDTTSNVLTEDIMVLRLNKQKSLFYSLTGYTTDSLLCSDQSSSVQMDILAGGSNKYGKRVVSYCVLKEHEKKEVTYTDNVGGEHYRYNESIPQFDWKITEEQKQIADYVCQKAVCTFRGRTYEAWFSSEIPLNDGPWKFCGLPGLILEVSDTQGHYTFTYAGMRQGGATIKLLPHSYTDTSREKYLKAYMNYMKDPVGFISASSSMKIKLVSSANNKPKAAKTVKFEPMERD